MEAAALALQRALSRGGRPGPDADFVSDAVVSRSDEVGGRGLFSTRALDVGEELLRVAHAALITAKVGQATAEGGALKRAADEVEDGGEWPAGVVIEPAPGEAVAKGRPTGQKLVRAKDSPFRASVLPKPNSNCVERCR